MGSQVGMCQPGSDACGVLQAMGLHIRVDAWHMPMGCRDLATASTRRAHLRWWQHTMPIEVMHPCLRSQHDWPSACSCAFWQSTLLMIVHEPEPMSANNHHLRNLYKPQHVEADHFVMSACASAGIEGGESVAAVAGGINAILWHELTSGICQLRVRYDPSEL